MASGTRSGGEHKGGPSSTYSWQFNGASLGCVTQPNKSPFPTVASTAWLAFRENRVRSAGPIFVGTSHETLDAMATAGPAVGYDILVEGNELLRSAFSWSGTKTCTPVNEHFQRTTVRGNECT